MKRMCRQQLTPSWRRRQLTCEELLRHVRIVTDPEKLAYLNAEAKRRRTISDTTTNSVRN
jgi:hypothetical protein